jgi:hypothetical protein
MDAKKTLNENGIVMPKAPEQTTEPMTTERTPQTIELDCAPGAPRPGDLIAGVLKGSGLEVRETVSRLFGNWVWDYSDVPAVTWAELQPLFKERITRLYKMGKIRYGSW